MVMEYFMCILARHRHWAQEASNRNLGTACSFQCRLCNRLVLKRKFRGRNLARRTRSSS